MHAAPSVEVARAAVTGEAVRSPVIVAGVPFAGLATPQTDPRRRRLVSAALERAASVIALALSRERTDATQRVQAVRRLLERVTRPSAGARLGDDAALASLSAAAGLPQHPRGWLAVVAADDAGPTATVLQQAAFDAGLAVAVAPVLGAVTAVVAVPAPGPGGGPTRWSATGCVGGELPADEVLADVLTAALRAEPPGRSTTFAIGAPTCSSRWRPTWHTDGRRPPRHGP
jgi:hypothetical protein